ncbi:hypothetical protein Pcinc_040099 [Petrolisthes cinctipes]|uniref:Uncharacterized protein n=1 Tax=Petrolisthes cinctipes TaxID=88211 RepID=A0AAE1BPV3_PETCI|nr:hypothetical protein Pcinc_040099 [Petrolisthes cinctipes]
METNQYLLFVDIKKGDLHRHYPANSKHQSLHVEGGPTGDGVSFALPSRGRTFLLSGRLGSVLRLGRMAP